MWRDYLGQDYLGYAAAALAVVNGVLAYVIARMSPRRSVLRLRLGALALLIALIAIGTTIAARLQLHVQAEHQQSDRVEARKRLENFMLEGQGLIGQIKDARRELPSRQADEWAQRVEVYLRDKLGERAVARFRRDVDELYGTDPTIAPDRMAYWKAVRNRVLNLEMISAELAGTQPRP